MSETETTPQESSPPEAVVGLLAQFETPQALKTAAAKVRDAGFRRWDAHSPFPVHGMERAMGLPPSVLPWLVLGAGITGGLVALLLQWWTNAIDYPFIISGKPLFSLPANIPVTFELIVLFSALTAFAGVIVLSLLPQFRHPVFTRDRFRSATSDGFFISIEAADAKFDESATRSLLEAAGATVVETCRESTEVAKFPKAFVWIGALAVSLATLPPLLIAVYRAVPKTSPRLHIIQDMDFQPKFKAQSRSPLASEGEPLFADGRSARPPIDGTIAVGGLNEDDHYYRGLVDRQPATEFPMPVSEEMARRGQQRYDIYCATCHGLLGDGRGMTAVTAMERLEPKWVPPPSLHTKKARDYAVGKLYSILTDGINTMPAYGPQIPVEDRWAIVLYLRALQQSRPVVEPPPPPEESTPPEDGSPTEDSVPEDNGSPDDPAPDVDTPEPPNTTS